MVERGEAAGLAVCGAIDDIQALAPRQRLDLFA